MQHPLMNELTAANYGSLSGRYLQAVFTILVFSQLT